MYSTINKAEWQLLNGSYQTKQLVRIRSSNVTVASGLKNPCVDVPKIFHLGVDMRLPRLVCGWNVRKSRFGDLRVEILKKRMGWEHK